MNIAERRISVLLVEDSEEDAFFFTRALAQTGIPHTLHVAEDGAEAVSWLRNCAAAEGELLPDIVFLDLKLPKLGGFEVLRWIREQPAQQDLKVVVLSGSGQPKDRETAAALGCGGYFVKPISAEEIAGLLPDLAGTLKA